MKRLITCFLLLATPALAQQQPPDPATLQRAITVIQQQRERAQNEAASHQIEAQRLAEENQKLKAELDALRKSSGQSKSVPKE